MEMSSETHKEFKKIFAFILSKNRMLQKFENIYAMNACPSHIHGFQEWRVMIVSHFPLSPSVVLLIFE